MAFLFTLFLAALSPGLLRAQAPAIGECQGGLSYVVAFPDTSTNTFDNRYQPKYLPRFEFFIYSSVEGNRVRVGSGAGASRTIVPQPGKFERVPAQPNPVVNFSGTPSFNTFKIEADYPIVVYAYFATPFGGEAFTPIPVESWGTEYYANMMPGEVINDLNPGGEFNYQRFPRTAPAEITVLSAFDDTRITIYNTAQLDGFPKTVDVELKAYQAYQIQSYVDTATENIGNPQPDLAGSIIISNNPIGVIATTSRTPNRDLGAGLGQNSMKNPLMEAMASKDQMGKKFVYLPAWDNSRPTGEPGEKTEEKRPHEIVRIVGVQQLPELQRALARQVGIGVAAISRLGLLFTIAWIVSLTEPVFSVFGNELSWRDLILIAGGIFLIYKAVNELHNKLEGPDNAKGAAVQATFAAVILRS